MLLPDRVGRGEFDADDRRDRREVLVHLAGEFLGETRQSRLRERGVGRVVEKLLAGRGVDGEFRPLVVAPVVVSAHPLLALAELVGDGVGPERERVRSRRAVVGHG